MARTTTLGHIETRIRRDLLNDNEADCYRWTVAQVLSRIRRNVLEVAFKINAWAASNQETGKRYYDIQSTLAPVETACDSNPPSGEIDDAQKTTLRAIVMPIDDRYSDAVAHLAAADLLETDNTDTINAQIADRYRALGREAAMK